MVDVSFDKRTYREMAKIRRDAEPMREALSRDVASRIIQSDAFVNADSVCCYVSFKSEVDTREILLECFRRNKTLSVPFCWVPAKSETSNQSPRLQLYRVESLDDLETSTYGIQEPRESLRTPKRLVPPDGVAVMIVPGLAFTESGDRLGYGKGYYDRVFSEQTIATKVAACFECQLFDALPTESHDVQMDWIATERRLFLAK